MLLSEASPTGTSIRSVEEQMLLVRILEDRLQELCLDGLAGDLHFNKGQEAISAGVCAVLRPTDYICVHHRTIAHAVAKGVPLGPLVAELLGKAGGINGGMAGEMHMSYLPARFMFSFQLVGTCVPVAAGIAWAVKNFHKTDDIVAVFHGDAATANGQWHEGLNLAAVQELPLLLVCENNHVAGNVTEGYYNPVSPAARAKGFGIATGQIDGNDLEAVIYKASFAVEYVRDSSRPYLLECDTVRLGRHKQGMGDLRTKEELARLSERDPLRKIVVAPERERYLREQVEAAIEAALAGPEPVLPKEG